MNVNQLNDEGYKILESNGFIERARCIFRRLELWDDMSFGLSLALSRNPTHPDIGTHLLANLWVIRLAGPPAMAVFYEVDEVERTVTYTGLSFTP